MTKTYVIDTNVLIQAPYAMNCFVDNNVLIPLVVLEELDGLKKAEGDKGANARKAIRNLEGYRRQGDLLEGVKMENGGVLMVEANCRNVELPDSLPESKMDNRILQVCKGHADKGENVVLVTKDIVLRIKADVLGIAAEDFTTEQVPSEQYTGRIECYVSEERFKDFKKKGIETKYVYLIDEEQTAYQPQLVENQFVVLKADQSLKKTHLGRVEGDRIVPLAYRKCKPYGVTPRNAGQYFLQEALMQPAEKAPLVIVRGMAGTAKTFYSIAVGMERLWNNPTGEYRKILITRPNAQFDSDIGFLPGDEQEKISPLMRPIIDNLEQLIDSNEEERYQDEMALHGKIEEIFARGIIQTEAMNYIRGRSFVNTYLIVDEAQNMTPNQMKGIITRAGKGTKIIILGDPKQIDNPFLDERTNGLSYAAEYMKGSPLCYQITLTADESERSKLAADAVHRL
ncbi:MAG: PhoH family protein [Clostridiales bacterium]|nr:PhoH family protein [Roseburia sp.]MDD7636605.1 PhoH family protein [Clostridiales bacterium]MDY4113715.1 PhoH family protein [Roseburia sp.]